MVLDELAAFLATQSVGTVGTNLFKGFMPATPDACVALREYGGYDSVRTFGTNVKAERPTLQIVARAGADDYQAARTKAEACYVALELAKNTLSSTVFFSVEPLQPPFVIRRDGNNRWEIGFNVLCYKERSAS